MSHPPREPIQWNDEARIACQFAFKCPKTWDRLTPTAHTYIRHCSACERDVHLAQTEEDFRRHAEGGHCVAVRVLRPDLTEEEPVYWVGEIPARYGVHLKKV